MDSDTNTNKICIHLRLNKNPEISSQIILHRDSSPDIYKKHIKKALSLFSGKGLRHFKKNGVEIFEEDFSYLKDQEIIYVSQGEDFNQESILYEYRNIKVLGKGGFGMVNLAEHRDT